MYASCESLCCSLVRPSKKVLASCRPVSMRWMAALRKVGDELRDLVDDGVHRLQEAFLLPVEDGVDGLCVLAEEPVVDDRPAVDLVELVFDA